MPLPNCLSWRWPCSQRHEHQGLNLLHPAASRLQVTFYEAIIMAARHLELSRLYVLIACPIVWALALLLSWIL